MVEADNRTDPDSLEDASVRRMRLLRIGVRNGDKVTLDAVKDDLAQAYGKTLGEEVYDSLFWRVVEDQNAADIKREYGIDLGKLS